MDDERHHVLTDGTIELRPFRIDDVDDITEACQDVEITRWTSIPSPYPRVFAEAFVDLQDQWRREGSGFHFAVVDRATGRLGGSIGLDAVRTPPAMVGYWVAPWARRRGLASRALILVTDWAFRELALDRIVLVTKPGNVASECVATRAGYALVSSNAGHGSSHGEEITVRRWERGAT